MKKKALIKLAAAMFFAALLPICNSYAEGFADTINNLVYTLSDVVDYANTNTKDRFFLRKNEMPEEIPVILPFEVKGENQVFVSNDGSDVNNGSIEKPFKTLKRALEYIEKVDVADRKKGMVIYLREGIYTIEEEINMTGKHSGAYDAPLYISAYNNEKVTLTTASSIPFKDFKPVTDENIRSRFYPEARDKIVEVDLKAYGITDYGDVSYDSQPTAKTPDPNLFCDETLMTLARYPNNTTLRVGERVDDPAKHEELSSNEKYLEWTMADDRALNWKSIDDARVFAYFTYNYNPEYKKILSIDKENLTAKVKGTLGANGKVLRTTPENTYYFYNVIEELDYEGEWYLDRNTGKLYIYPPSYADEDSVFYFAVKSNNIISGTDMKNVVFNGIEFKNVAAKAIGITYGDYIVVQNCDFINCTSGGAHLNYCTNSGVTTCYLLGCTGNGILMAQERFEDPYREDLVSRNNFVQNNFIEGGKNTYSKLNASGNGVVISHNLAVDSTHGNYAGDGLNWYLEYNESTGGDKLQGDGAPYYTGGSAGTYAMARYNYLHNPAKNKHYGRGLYFDEGGAYFTAYGNVLQGGEYGSFSHNGKFGVWYNNLFLDNKKAAATSANYFSQYKNFRTRAFHTHENSWYCVANRHSVDPTTYEWIKIFPEHEEYFDKIYEYHDFLNNNPTNEMGEVEEWLLDANYFYLGNNLNLGGGHEIALTSRDTIIDENNYEVTKEDFADYDNGDFTVVNEELLAKMPGFEQIPMDKIGLILDCDKWRDLKMGEFKDPMFPKSGYENRLAPADINFEWLKVKGASFYRLIISDDENFENIVYDEIQDQPYAYVDLEPNKHYFYKIIAQSKAKTLNYAEVESDVYDFYTMTLEESNLVSKAEKKELISGLSEAQEICDAMVEGDGAGQYPAGTKMELQSFINNTKVFMEETNVQGYIDDKLEELNRKVFDMQKRVKSGTIVQLDPSADNWEKLVAEGVAGGQDKAIKLENDGSGNLVFNTLMDSSVYIRNKQTIPYGAFATVKIKPDSLESWQLFGGLTFSKPKNGLGSNDLYSTILSKDSDGNYSIELQTYKNEGGLKDFQSVVNSGIINANEWADVAIGTIPTENGTRIVIIVNDKLIYDKEYAYGISCYYKDSNFIAHRATDNTQTEYAKSDRTYEDIMAIVNAAE